MYRTNHIHLGRQAAILLAFAAIALAFPSCDSDLLSMPPAADTVNLTAVPSEATTSNSITLTYATDQTVIVTVEYGTVSGTYTNATPRTTVAAMAHSTEIIGLSPSTDYFYRIVSYLDGARAFPSEEFTFQTLVDPAFLQIATGPTVTPTLTSLGIAFNSNSACTSLVEYGTALGGPYTASTVQTTVPSTIHAVNLAGLATATTYYYRVKMFWDSGDDFISGEFSAATGTEPAPTAAQKARGIWMLGGLSGATVSTALAPVDLYDPVTNTWYPAATSIPSTGGHAPVSFAGYAAYNGQLFVIGGFDSTGAVRNTVQIYTIATNTWSLGTTMTTPRANIHATVLDGKIYVLSGTQANATTAWAGAPAPTGVCYEYVPGGSWTAKTGYTATNSSERFAFGYKSTLYSIGGRSAAAAVAAIAHDGYVPWASALTSTITEVAMATPRTGVTGVMYDAPEGSVSSVILIGGMSAVAGTTGCFINFPTTASGTFSPLMQYLAYPFATPAAWSQASENMPLGSGAFGSAVISRAFASPRIYYFGGTGSLGTTPSVSSVASWIPPPAPPATWADTWTGVTAMSRARWGHGAVTLNQ